MQISMIFSSGMLINKESTSRLAKNKLGSFSQISSPKWNESVYSFWVKVVKNGSKNFASLYVGVPIAYKIGWKGGRPFLISLCTFPNPYKTPGLDPAVLMFL